MKPIILFISICLALTAPTLAQTSPIPNDALIILVNARTDLELLAEDQLSSQRPVGWSGSLDINDPQLALLARLDLELLAARLDSVDDRPEGWFGAAPGSYYEIARDIRHDLELLADFALARNQRPLGWVGGTPLMRCDRDTQTLAEALYENVAYRPAVDPLAPGYCAQIDELLREYAANNPQAAIRRTSTSAPQTTVANRTAPAGALLPGPAAYGFLDRYATQRIGIIPEGETFVALARSFTLFSRMTLVRGNGFEVFVDWKTTSMNENQFRTLPDVNTFDANPSCTAEWCTLTLIPPIEQQARRASSSARSGLRQVPAGDNMRIYVDADGPEGARVRMELCVHRTKAANPMCSTVTTVLLPGGGALAPVGNLGGMPQFILPYGYSSYRLESACCYTNEVYVSYSQNR